MEPGEGVGLGLELRGIGHRPDTICDPLIPVSYELLGAPVSATTSGRTHERRTALQRVVDETTRVVDNVNDDQLGNATPCTEWTVRDLINHITGGATMFAISAEQGSVPDEQLGQLMGGDNLGNDSKGAWGVAANRAMTAFDGLDLSKIVKLPFGEMPAGVALNIAIFDVATHAVDIARRPVRRSPTPICSRPRSRSASR